MHFFLTVYIKFFFLFTPFFALSMFLSMTNGYSEAQRRALALRVMLGVAVLCMGLFFFGNTVFALLGITLDSFRVGAGALLFLSAVTMVRTPVSPSAPHSDEDIAIVPLAMPIIVGPATTGALLVMGAEITDRSQKAGGAVALLVAVACVGALLFVSSVIERALRKKGINILTKVTGLVLAALAAQMILTGLESFFGGTG